jgi:hypothetical protein
MIRHIVLWTIQEGDHPDVKLDRMVEVKARLMSLKDQIPEIHHFEVQLNATNAPKDNYDVILIGDFNSWADLQTYQKHPAHLLVGDYIKNVKQDRSCIDFEI